MGIQLNGKCKQYWDNGQLWRVCSYVYDKMNGMYKAYDSNGELVESCVYNNGIKIEDKLLS